MFFSIADIMKSPSFSAKLTCGKRKSQRMLILEVQTVPIITVESAGALSWGEKPTVSVSLFGLSATHLKVDSTERINRNVDSQFDPLKHKHEHTHTHTHTRVKTKYRSSFSDAIHSNSEQPQYQIKIHFQKIVSENQCHPSH